MQMVQEAATVTVGEGLQAAEVEGTAVALLLWLLLMLQLLLTLPIHAWAHLLWPRLLILQQQQQQPYQP